MDIIQRAREQIKRRYIEATDHEQNAYESMLKLIGLNEELTASNERLNRVVEQATKGMSVDEYGDVWIDTGIGQWMQVGSESKTPDLFAQLKGDTKDE